MSTLQDRVFQKLFETAEIAKFTPAEREAYEESLKYFRDLNNVVDTSRKEGLQQGLQQGMMRGVEQRSIEIAKEMKANQESVEKIMQYTGLSRQQIEDL